MMRSSPLFLGFVASLFITACGGVEAESDVDQTAEGFPPSDSRILRKSENQSPPSRTNSTSLRVAVDSTGTDGPSGVPIQTIQRPGHFWFPISDSTGTGGSGVHRHNAVNQKEPSANEIPADPAPRVNRASVNDDASPVRARASTPADKLEPTQEKPLVDSTGTGGLGICSYIPWVC